MKTFNKYIIEKLKISSKLSKSKEECVSKNKETINNLLKERYGRWHMAEFAMPEFLKNNDILPSVENVSKLIKKLSKFKDPKDGYEQPLNMQMKRGLKYSLFEDINDKKCRCCIILNLSNRGSVHSLILCVIEIYSEFILVLECDETKEIIESFDNIFETYEYADNISKIFWNPKIGKVRKYELKDSNKILV